MAELINLREFIEENYKGFPENKKLAVLPPSPGVVIKDGEIYLSPYTPEVDYLYHQGSFVGFNPDFDNLENLRQGYFGDPTCYTYLSTDMKVKASKVLTDLFLKIDYEKLNRQVYRDPETCLEKFHYEWNRAFIIQGAIPKSAIVEISFPEKLRYIPELPSHRDTILNLDQHFERIKELRKEFAALF